MIGDKIVIRLINKDHERKLIEKTLIDIEYVEQLVHYVLEEEKVGPVCRNLFGLHVVGRGVWLAPNIPLRSILEWSNRRRSNNDAKLEIRMRFRPACFKLISFIDKPAFDIIFAQVLYDFMRTRFNDDDRDLVLLNDSVLILVALNLVRHSIEHGININEIIQAVDLKEFIPKRVSRWQRTVLSWLSDPMNLQKSLKIGIEQFDNDLQKIKRKFIEIFLTKVAPDYLAEVHTVQQLTPTINPESEGESGSLRARVRYSQTQDDSRCLVETCSDMELKSNSHRSCKHSKPRETWNVIFDIDTISHATLHECDVQIVGLKYEPFMLRFQTTWEARSFLASIDGYQRLMKKWAFNLCPQVFSPELRYLEEIGCHGPIGYETSVRKLAENKRPGGFLMRKCMESPNLYLIDTLLTNRVMLTIDVEWNPSSRLFRKLEHSTNSKRTKLVVRTDRGGYTSLRGLIEGTEIRFTRDSEEHDGTFQQLKHMIRPKESDDLPALTLSMSRNKIKELCRGDKSGAKQSMNQLPRLIPRQLLKFSGNQFYGTDNGLAVELAHINGDQLVVVKNIFETKPIGDRKSERLSCTFHICPSDHCNLDHLNGLRSSQMSIANWVFVHSNLFAETIGYVVPEASIIQEYFPLGSLESYLRRGAESSQIVLLSASLQLAQALIFLSDQRIIHGKIRCRNMMVMQERPIQIKLTDPLGQLDPEQDQAFIPPEYFSSSVQICVREFYTGIDVWAAGTTIWQMFNRGVAPPSGRYANTLTQTQHCPEKVWALIESCWIIEPNSRVPPRILHRDLFDLIAWEEGSHEYFHISQTSPSQDSLGTTPRTAGSSVSDLSTLHTVDSSHLSSPTSMSTDGSQTDLLRRRSNGLSVLQKQSSASSNPVSSYLPSIRRPNWASLINLKRNMKRYQMRDDLPPHHRLDLSHLSQSRLSLVSSSNRSTSETTKSTDALDIQSLSEAVDKCVWIVEMNRLRLAAEIGRGSSGVVSKGFLSQHDGQELVVAVKSIGKRGADPIDEKRVEDLKREFDIMKNLSHENIVKTLGYVESAQIMLIFEYMPLGSLLSCVRSLACHGDLTDLPLRKYALDIAKGMEYLASMKIVHRDLALRNILLKSRNEVKICDFGLAQYLGSSSHYELETDRALPLKWYAPETIDTWVFTHKSDVWSYGVVLWELYSGGDSPQYSGSYEALSEILKHERLSRPASCPGHMYDLMLSCWTYDPGDRMSFAQIRRNLEQTKNCIR